MNFYKHHLGDYDGATAHLDWCEDMAYTRLLRVYYRREQPIPADLQLACRLVRASTATQRKAVETVLNEFFELRADGWHNHRADEEIAAYQAQASTNRRIAQSRSGQRIVNESLNEPSTKRIPNQEPLTKNQEPEPEPEKPKSKASPAVAVAAKTADPAKDEIWRTGVGILRAEGKTNDAARSFLGMLCKDYGQVLVLQAIRDCERTVPAQPSAWLKARCQERRANGVDVNAAAATKAKQMLFGEKDITDESKRI